MKGLYAVLLATLMLVGLSGQGLAVVPAVQIFYDLKSDGGTYTYSYRVVNNSFGEYTDPCDGAKYSGVAYFDIYFPAALYDNFSWSSITVPDPTRWDAFMAGKGNNLPTWAFDAYATTSNDKDPDQYYVAYPIPIGENVEGFSVSFTCTAGPGACGSLGSQQFTVNSLCNYAHLFTGTTELNPTTGSNAPTANAGPNKTVHEGSLVTLDASGSSDPSGKELTYSWSFVSVPTGSTATLSDPTALHPTFTADQLGNYVVQLIVTNRVGVASSPATVTISTYNTPPVADPGLDQAVTQIGTTVQLDGSHSYDADGDTMTYSWSFVSIPAGSKAILTAPISATPTFIADVHGTYVVQLVVRDPWGAGAPKTVTVSFTNIKPVANAGAGQAAVMGDPVTLDGSSSSDANLDPLTYQWSFASVPAGSNPTITNPTAVQSTFVPDRPGIYVAQLIVNDGFVNSDPSTAQIKVVSVLDNALKLVRDLVITIGSLDHKVFKNRLLQIGLIIKLLDVMTDLEKSHHGDALQDMQGEILKRVDGCALSGAPDKDDWIIDCQAQTSVYQKLMGIISEVKELMGK